MKKGRVFLLTVSMGSGGAERQMLWLKQEPSLEIDKIICLYPGNAYGAAVEDMLVLSKTPVIHPLFWGLRCPLYLWQLSRIIQHEDRVLSFLEIANLLNLILRVWKKHQAIISVRTTLESHYAGSFAKRGFLKILRFFYQKAPLICSNSEGARQNLIRLGLDPSKIKTIPNAHDLEKIQDQGSASQEGHGFLAKNEFLLCNGRLLWQKGYHQLLLIFAQVKKNHPQLKLVILGEGPLLGSLVEQAQDLGLKTYNFQASGACHADYDVYFLGFQQNPHWFAKHCTLFVFPSLYEGSPNALIEAMALGAPCLSADCPSGPREILAPELDLNETISYPHQGAYGVLLPVVAAEKSGQWTANQQIWVETIDYYLQNAEQRAKVSSRSTEAAARFDQKVVLKNWQKFLDIA
jgi:glycosyltransferase involved in cell wall biosynthesis